MDKKSARIRRAARARHMMREQGVTRLVIHRTPRHIYAQLLHQTVQKCLPLLQLLRKQFVSK